MNDIVQLLADVSPLIGAGWVAWFGTGAILVVWYRRAKATAELEAAAVPRSSSRSKSGVRPASAAVRTSGVRHASTVRPASDGRPAPDLASLDLSVPVAAAKAKTAAPIVVGDPFGDLATLLDQPGGQEQSAFRAPGDSPILNSAGSPMLRDDE